jgi:hypothetical protein
MITQFEVERADMKAGIDMWWLTAVSAIVVAILLSSLFSPDMVTGSQQEHLPIAAFTDWLWGAAAIGYLAFVRRGRSDPTLGISVTVLWAAVALTSIFAPEFITGSDPTSIPIAAMIAPVIGTIVTGFLALNSANSRS